MAARNEGATLEECGEALGKSSSWVKETLKWYLRNGQDPTPYAHDTYADRAPKRAARERTFSRRSRPFLAHDRHQG